MKPVVALLAIPALVIGIAAIVIWRTSLAGFFQTNYLYHLGHGKQWAEASKRLDGVPETSRGARYNLIKMNILLNLSRTSEVLKFARGRPLERLSAGNKRRTAFEHLEGFALILVGKDEEAAELFRKHSGSRLSAAMAALLDQAREVRKGKAEVLPKRDALPDLIEKEMMYPQLYKHAAAYLLARCHIQRGEFAEAVEPLEEACAQYPYYPVFHRCLARAYLAQQRYDLATMHLTIARNQLRDASLHVFSTTEEEAFETIVLREAMEQMETTEPSNFWRLLRGLKNLFPETLAEPPGLFTPRAMSLAEIWECGSLFRGFRTEKPDDLEARNLRPEDYDLFRTLERVTASPPAKPLEIDLADGTTSPALSRRLLSVTPINRRESVIAHDSQLLSFSVPFSPGRSTDKVLDAVLLFRLSGTERQGVAGGCEVRLGQDSYWIYPDTEKQWYGIRSPFLSLGKIPLEFRFNHDFIPGYSDPGKKGDRNLLVSTILLCALYERGNG